MIDNRILEAMAHTWPPERVISESGVTVRLGAGGGKRASSIRFKDDTPEKLQLAFDMVARHGAEQLFQLDEDQKNLDLELDKRGFRTYDATLIYTISLANLDYGPSPVTAFEIWPPLAIICDIWSQGGIGPARVAVMERVDGPKTCLLGRIENRAAGAAFVAIHEGIAVLHALEIVPRFRRFGLARQLAYAALNWSRDHGADTFALAVTERNAAARNLYSSLGMTVAGRYHYRVKP